MISLADLSNLQFLHLCRGFLGHLRFIVQEKVHFCSEHPGVCPLVPCGIGNYLRCKNSNHQPSDLSPLLFCNPASRVPIPPFLRIVFRDVEMNGGPSTQTKSDEAGREDIEGATQG